MTDEPVPVAAPRVVSLYNAANALTVLRLILVPVFLAMVVASQMTDHDWRIGACVAFCVASATDFVDGWIARRWHLVTSFGKIADPIADKALTGTALVLLSAYDQLPWWITVVILAREWGITALRFWVIRYGVIPASRGGKLKTGLQTLAIAWYLWPVPEPFDVIGTWVMYAALIVTVVTGVDYVIEALRLRRAARLA
ncbi:CDP-diacylglycerol--glycerol-3-phosphate 3-phosphatidyltransferase [Actinoplanes octamycinicus]|uniref:CDP-diacylglycerol--glycerol-3-phosphate 3-phosphatidyltransferase n=1 Tax=Actinoplanes octamycinicus TaxID=135948 RepID=A0A7W7M4R5_9ACTN|nr:CDP-diacylglycerol--glycerol-3-phosphate 3-phosphatidyltransferase [Actinoplanes octamycinicus]MBB4736908.1 CDP-diacylglycerol--glycerol-3-phosphate 3-phosphatidyltransferase [Actinoplanes octamycinicus]GIE63345.1 CDP-diacylglycerol--glycerol-3-phosphate 3-phosphatidyltransferase [Actinoplanes octamycinicus]